MRVCGCVCVFVCFNRNRRQIGNINRHLSKFMGIKGVKVRKKMCPHQMKGEWKKKQSAGPFPSSKDNRIQLSKIICCDMTRFFSSSVVWDANELFVFYFFFQQALKICLFRFKSIFFSRRIRCETCEWNWCDVTRAAEWNCFIFLLFYVQFFVQNLPATLFVHRISILMGFFRQLKAHYFLFFASVCKWKFKWNEICLSIHTFWQMPNVISVKGGPQSFIDSHSGGVK